MLSVQLNVAVLTREFRISSRNEKRRIVPSPFARRQFSLVLFFPPLYVSPYVSCPEDNSRRRRDKVVRLGNPVKLQTCTERHRRLSVFFFFVFNKISSRAHARARIGSLSLCLSLPFFHALSSTYNATLRCFLFLQ